MIIYRGNKESKTDAEIEWNKTLQNEQNLVVYQE